MAEQIQTAAEFLRVLVGAECNLRGTSAVTHESAISTRTRQQPIINSSGAIFITILKIDSLVETEEYPLTGGHHRRRVYRSLSELSSGADIPTNVAKVCQCRGCGRSLSESGQHILGTRATRAADLGKPQSSLPYTIAMARNLRVTKWLGPVPAVGLYSDCGRELKVPLALLKQTSEAQESLRKQFVEHKCPCTILHLDQARLSG